MNINIEIKHVGQAIGTIGWLCENAAVIKIGPTATPRFPSTETSKQGAWLKDKAGNIITVLAVRDYFDDGSMVKAERATYGPELCSDIAFTDAAWEIVQQLQNIAVESMEEREHAELAAAYSISVSK